MPLTSKGQKIMSAMQSQYGPEKGERVFYAARNAGRITGVDPGHWQGGPVYFWQGGPVYGYAGGGIVEHNFDPELPPHQDDASLVQLTQYPPAYLQTIERLLANQRQRMRAPPGYYDYPLPLRRFWWGGWV